MDCKEAQILMAPHIMGDLDSDSRSHDLDAHLLRCRACSLEYKAIRETLGLIDEHKSLFAEAFEAVERKRVAEQSEMKRGWEAIEAKLAKIEAPERPQRRVLAFRTLLKAAAVAACLVIGVSIWTALSNRHESEKPVYQRKSPLLAGSVEIEMLLDEGRISIPAGQQITTSTDELKTLSINGRHRLTMNADSTLSIEPFQQEGRLGCIVKLACGEIFARVERNGAPFVVNTSQGRAVITGTVFD
ncbi:MAG: FecR domain-containing protein, partial [Planctomycetota bacterium]